jgi:hypothetical protein
MKCHRDSYWERNLVKKTVQKKIIFLVNVLFKISKSFSSLQINNTLNVYYNYCLIIVCIINVLKTI